MAAKASRRSRLISRRRPTGQRAAQPPTRAEPAPFWTRPKKIAAVVLPLLAAWAVPFFAPGLWEGTKQLAGQDPLSVTVLTADQFQSPVEADASGEHVIPLDVAEIRPVLLGSEPAAYQEWLAEVGAVDAGSTVIRLVLRATGSWEVTIQQVGVEVPRRDPPLAGVHVTGDKGGVVEPRYLRADLDAGEVVWSDSSGAETGPLTLTVSDTEEEVLDLLAHTGGEAGEPGGCDCHWVVRVTYTVEGGEAQRLLVRPAAGTTFRTTALARAATWNVGLDDCTDVPGLPPRCDARPD